MKKIFLLFTVLLCFTACSLEPRIDASSEESMQKSIASVMKELDFEEQEKFQEALKVIMFSGVNSLSDLATMGQNIEITKGAFQAKIDGKSAKEVINLAEEIRRKRVDRNQDQTKINSTNHKNIVNKLVEEGESETHQKLLNEAVNVSLKSIKDIEGDYGQRYVQVEIVFENISDKNIKGVKGVAVFDDIFGDTIKSVQLSSDEPILKGSTYSYQGSIRVNQFISQDLKLANTPIDKIQFSFQVETVLFADDEENISKNVSGVAVSADDFLNNK